MMTVLWDGYARGETRVLFVMLLCTAYSSPLVSQQMWLVYFVHGDIVCCIDLCMATGLLDKLI